jgi:uncharacterized Ntn-hydrolase superfamily protein
VTLSIVAYDVRANVVGAAVTSCVVAAGRRVLHVRPGVGAAVAQASSEITWGEEILDALAAGRTPADAIAPFAKDRTQLAAVDFTGGVAVHTGPRCDSHAADAVQPVEHVSAQVNTAALADAAERMLHAFHALGDGAALAERLVAALAASGDDARGKQSAAVIVAGPGPLTGYADEPHVDLRVDDHRDPVAELERLLALHRAHCAMRLAFADAGADLLAVVAPLAERHPDDPHLARALDTARKRREAGGSGPRPA